MNNGCPKCEPASFVYENSRMAVDNGCPKCEASLKKHIIGEYFELCLDCQLEQLEQDKDVAINEVERLKQRIAKENTNELPTNKNKK